MLIGELRLRTPRLAGLSPLPRPLAARQAISISRAVSICRTICRASVATPVQMFPKIVLIMPTGNRDGSRSKRSRTGEGKLAQKPRGGRNHIPQYQGGRKRPSSHSGSNRPTMRQMKALEATLAHERQVAAEEEAESERIFGECEKELAKLRSELQAERQKTVLAEARAEQVRRDLQEEIHDLRTRLQVEVARSQALVERTHSLQLNLDWAIGLRREGQPPLALFPAK